MNRFFGIVSWVDVPKDNITIIASNLIPLLGVIILDWTLLEIFLIYWGETALIGAFGAARLAAMRRAQQKGAVGWVTIGTLVAFFLALLFVGLLGIQRFIAGWFVVEELSVGDVAAMLLAPALALSLAVFAAQHARSFAVDFLRAGRHRSARLTQVVRTPYYRAVALWVTLAGGVVLVRLAGHTVAILLLLIGLKLFGDLYVTDKTTDSEEPPR